MSCAQQQVRQQLDGGEFEWLWDRLSDEVLSWDQTRAARGWLACGLRLDGGKFSGTVQVREICSGGNGRCVDGRGSWVYGVAMGVGRVNSSSVLAIIE